MDWKQLNSELGNIDLYWLDFILKGYLPDDAKVLDAGCGEGRNLTYCLKNNLDIFGIDQNPEAINFLKLIAKKYKLGDLDARFQVMKLDKILFPDSTFDIIIGSAVLHFAKNVAHFNMMINELIRLLKPNGKIFIRTMTDRYFPENIVELEEGVFQFQNKQIRFVINADVFVENLRDRQLELIEPYKEVLVENRHTMGTFMFQKQI
ncbi:class I SAM-dependent methyltransferase [Marivirga salinae]|uniref:Class I SAM-dependent methyltransferase n=1 Tax=Marivirga salinarum TaxID=3059078 RepID=A0AA49GB57_9BACT|nr:class I SAM-dependent methyltransferase [Marivirga sp. BDSF4-3]WKK76408.2 class I SAM-dependent methyltransferase [Marivirga sp. BDSF4-3]